MTQTINNVSDAGTIIAKAAAAMLADKLQFIKSIDKEPESSFSQVNGYNSGDTITISKPARFKMGTTADITSTIQEVIEEKTTLTLDKQRNVPISLTSAEIATDLSLKSWGKRILDPAMSSLAQGIEAEVITLAKNSVGNSVGTPGATVYDTDTMLYARELIKKNLCPQDDKLFALLESRAMRSAVNARKGLFQSSSDIAKQYREGYVGMSDGFNFLEGNLNPLHTNGADVAVAVEASVVAIANGMSTLGVDGVTSAATITAGSVFTIANVYAVHPITKQTLSHLQQFVVTAAVTEASGNAVTMAISPSIYYTTTDPRQNVNAAPVDEASVTFIGSASTGYQQNIAYHKSAFRFASVPLMKPNGAHMTATETVDGITVRVWQDASILTDKMILRLDVLYGFVPVRPEWSCRLWS